MQSSLFNELCVEQQGCKHLSLFSFLFFYFWAFKYTNVLVENSLKKVMAEGQNHHTAELNSLTGL